MNQLHFFQEQKIKTSILKKNGKPSVWRGLYLLCFWVLSIGNMWSQPIGGNSQQNILAPNISYSTPQNYLLNAAITNLAPANSGGSIPAATYKQVSTFAGTTSGFLDGTVATAKMNGPLGMTMDANGDIYFIDSVNFRIRKMTTTLQGSTTVTTITTIAGDGYSFLFYGRLLNNATGTSASFNYPTDIALDTANKCLYVTDKENDVIRKVSLADNNHTVTTFAGSGTSTSTDGIGLAATFKKPSGIAIDPTGTYLYVTDRTSNKIRRITISTAQVTTIAGSGTAGTTNSTTGTSATFNAPTGIAVDANYIYVTDFSGNKIRKISLTANHEVTTLAGSGTSGATDDTGALATFNNPYGLTLDPAGNLFVAEWGNKIRKITPDGVVTTFAGSGTASSIDANGAKATFNEPSNIVISPTSGFGYVSEYAGDQIRKIELGGYELPSSPALPTGISFDVTTGTFSGTPSARNNGPVNYTVTGYNYYGSATSTVSITTGELPALGVVSSVSAITATTATAEALANDNGISNSYTIEGGGAPTPLIEKGLCWSTSANPTILDSKVANSNLMTGMFTNNLTGLTPLTTYYVRAYATTGLGTGYGNQVSFTTKMQVPVISYNTTNVFTANTTITPLQLSSTGGLVSGLAVPTVSTFAGSYPTGFVNGNGTAAKFQGAANLATDSNGNVFVADSGNNAIRKITPDGMVSTLATGLTSPTGVATDSAGNVYVADTNTSSIRKITPSGVVSTIAGNGFVGATNGNGVNATFKYPQGIAVDASGNVYVADTNNYLIRKITPTGDVTTLAGSVGVSGSLDGTGTNASFTTIKGIATDVLGNVYVADLNNHLIRKITPSGVVSTLAGNVGGGSIDGTGTAASFYAPKGVAVDTSGNVYVADTNNNRIRKITPAGVVTTLAGTGTNSSVDGIGIEATFSNPTGITVDASGNLYVSEGYTSVIRKISFLGFSISPALPAGLVLNADGSITGTPTVTSPATTYTITATNAGGSSATTVNIAVVVTPPAITYTASNQFAVNTAITALQVSNTGGTIPSQLKNNVTTLAGNGTTGSTDATGTSASFRTPFQVAVDAAGTIYVADIYNNKIRKITPTGAVSTLAGSGTAGSTDATGAAASFYFPHGVAIDAAGTIYVADTFNNKIRKITPTGAVSTLAGSGTVGSTDATGTSASFYYPEGVAVDAAGNVYVADTYNNNIRKITPAGVVTTLAGSGTTGSTDGTGIATSFARPTAVAADTAGNVYVADTENHKIRKITPSGVVSTLAGSGTAGSNDATGASASFNLPNGVAVDAASNVYVADTNNRKIRKITPAGVVSTLAGSGTNGSTDSIGTSASFNNPLGLTVDASGTVYVADTNNKIRKITQLGYSVSSALPVGLVLNTDGSISGTPTVVSPATDYVITATNAGGSSTYSVNIEILPTLPSIDSDSASAITTTSAAVRVYVFSNGNATITAQGVCWSTAPNPTLANSTTTDASGTTTFTNTLSNLLPSTIYYARAYATNSVGTAYGSEIVFTTPTPVPVISYTTPNNLVLNAAVTPLLVTNTGGAIPSTLKITDVTTFSGNGSSGVADGIATSANFAGPSSVATDVLGNVYVADRDNNKIRKITPNGTASTFAGSGTQGATDGTGTGASFFAPEGVAVDALGNVYVADSANNRIRKITSSGVVSTLAGGKLEGNKDGDGTSATFRNPKGVAVDAAGNVYVADTFNHSIRKIAPSGDVTTLAGGYGSGDNNGPGLIAHFNYPQGITLDAEGNILVADNGNHEIRKITPAGEVSSYAGGGSGYPTSGFEDGDVINAQFSNPRGVSVDVYGNVYVADSNNSAIRKITLSGVVSTLTGTGNVGSENGTFSTATFSTPTGLAVDALGNIYVADSGNNEIRKISQYGYSVTPALPSGLTLNTDGSISGTPTVESPATNYTVTATNAGGSSTKSVSIAVYSLPVLTTNNVTGITATHANSGGTLITLGNSDITNIGVCWSTSSNPTIADSTTDDLANSDTFDSYIRNLLPLTTYYLRAYATNSAGTAYGNEISFTTLTNSPAISYTAFNEFTTNTAITALQVTNSGSAIPSGLTNTVTTFAGSGTAGATNGTGTAASFNGPMSMVKDAAGNIYVSDSSNYTIRKITPAGVVSTFAGNGTSGSTDGTGTAASFGSPMGLTIDATDNLYVADFNGKIRKISPSGVVSTFAGSGTQGSTDGTGTEAKFRDPVGLTIDATGNLYVADAGNFKIRKITPSGVVTTFAGSGTSGSTDGTGTDASFGFLFGNLAVDTANNVYVADTGNNKIRKITPAGVVTTFAGSGTAGAGDGVGTVASFYFPVGLLIDSSGSLYVADGGNNKIRKITSTGVVTTIAGSGIAGSTEGTATAASFNLPYGVVQDATGGFYIADGNNNKIRKMSLFGYSVSPALPAGLILNADGSISGTPTVASAATDYTVTATNAVGSSSFKLNITINAILEVPTASAQTFCGSKTVADLVATGTNLKWYAATTGGTALASNVALATGNYYVSQTINSIESNRTSVVVTVNTTAAPTAAAQTLCGGKTVADIVATGTNLQWYSAPTGGTALASTTLLVSGNYYVYVSQTLNGCESTRTSVVVNVKIATPAPIVSAQTFCSGATVANLVAIFASPVRTLSPPRNIYIWHATATGPTSLNSNVALATGTYYVSLIQNSCESTRTPVAVTVNTTAAPTASAQTFCGSKTVADLVATGTNLQWYVTETGGTALASIDALETGTYYVSQTLDGCESTRTSVVVTVNNSFAGTISADQLIFIGAQPADITLTNSSGSVQWQSSLNNTTFTNIVGATNTTLTSAQMGVLATKRYYRAIVKSGDCSLVTSGVIAVYATKPTKIQDSQCGATLPDLFTNIFANWVTGVSNYRFKVVNGATIRTVETIGNAFSLSTLSADALYNTTYTISVATKANGVWGDYGPSCNVSTPIVPPATKVVDTQCGTILPDLYTKILANWVSGVSNYRFKVVNGATIRTVETAGRAFSLSSLSVDALYNTTYTINVATKANGVWGDYGPSCTISTPIVPPATKVVDTQCGTTLPDLYTNILANWVSGVSNYRFKVVNGATIRTVETIGNAFSLSTLSADALYNTTYTINVATKTNGVWSDYGTSCTISTPIILAATKVVDAQCGTTLPDLYTNILANSVSGVSNYRFKVVNGATIRTVETAGRIFSLSSLSADALYNTTYTISVATKMNGVWGDYGLSCTISTPIVPPATKVVDAQCGTTLPDLYTNILANWVSGVSNYRFKVVNGATIRTVETAGRAFSLSSLSVDALYNTTYTINVATKVNGVWGDYGPSCTISTPIVPPTTKVVDTQCGTILPDLYTNILANMVSGVSNYRFKVVNGATIRTVETVGRAFSLSSLSVDALYNTTYTIYIATKVNGVWGDYGPSCTISTPIVQPATKVVDTQCGTILPDLYTNILANMVSGVSNYRFKVVNGATIRTVETAGRAFSLSSLSVDALYNTTYTINIATKVNGVWGDYGPSCTISTPIVQPATKVVDTQCGTTLPDLYTNILANWVSGVSNYRFKVVNGATIQTVETVGRAFNLKSLTGGALYNTQYTISVATKYNGVWGDYDTECTVTTPPNPAQIIQVAKKTVSKENVVAEISVKAYPNPFTTIFKLDFNSPSDSNVDVSVYDMIGRLLENHHVISSEINNLELGYNYPAGVYNVIVTQGSEVKILRVIKK